MRVWYVYDYIFGQKMRLVYNKRPRGRLQEKEHSIGAMGGVRKLLGALMNEGVQKVGLIMEQSKLGARIRDACKKEF